MEKNGINVSSASGSTAFVSSLSSRQSPWQSPCSTLYYMGCEKHNLDTNYVLAQLPWLRTLLPGKKENTWIELSRTLVPGTNTIPQILPPPQRIGASSLNQVHRQHCNINDFLGTHKTRRRNCINHLQAPHSLQSCHRRSTFVAPPLDLLLRRHTPGTPGQGSILRTFWV